MEIARGLAQRRLPPPRLPPERALAIAIAAELVYVGGRVLVQRHVPGVVAGEITLTAWRVASLAFYAWLFWEPLKAAWRAPVARRVHPLLWVAITLDLLIALTAGYWQNREMAVKMVFALTTPVVALREEVFYRFILQDGLERRMAALPAIALSSAAFVVYHAGYQPMDVAGVLMLLAAGVLMGVAYQRTRSLRLVVGVHLVMDLAFLVSAKMLGPGWVLLGFVLVPLVALLAWSMDRTLERMGI